MIIIKTSNGDVFVNEAEMMHVQHLHDTRQVKIEKRTGTTTINDVETITYTTKDTEWKDDGSNLAHLHKLVTQLERQYWYMKGLAERKGDAMREFDRKLYYVNTYMEENNLDELRKTIKNYTDRRPGIMENIEEWEESEKEWREKTASIALEQIEQDKDLERQRQMERKKLEDENANIRRKYFDAETENCRLLSRNLWQRIRNK